MADVKDVKRTKSGRLTYRGESFPVTTSKSAPPVDKKNLKCWRKKATK